MKQETKFKDTEIGKIPENWQVIEFGKLLKENTRNGIYKQKKFHGTGIKIVNMKELFAYEWIGSQAMTMIDLTENEKKNFLLNPGDLIFARRSLVASGAGKCSIIVEHSEPLTFESSIIRARPDEKLSNPLFLYYLFRSSYGKYIVGTILRQVAVSGITGSDLVKLPFPIPPLSEQKDIANELFTIDAKIELNHQMNKTLEAIGRALFKHWFVDFEFPNEEGKPYKSSGGELVFNEELGKEIPKGWEVKPIKELCKSISNGGTPRRMESAFWNGNINWYKTGELFDNPLLESEEKITEKGLNNSACKLWDENTILVALYASPTVGRLGILKTKATSNQACSGLIAKDEIGYPFLFYTLLSKRGYFNNLAVGAAQQNINAEIVKETKVIKPGSTVLGRFNLLTFNAFDKRTQLLKEVYILSQIRDSLLPKLMSGKIRVPVEVE